MRGILVIAHGSRATETEATLESILEIVKNTLGDCILEHAFMELSEKTIEIAIDNLLDKGITEIKVVPYFLFAGIHIREDIPKKISKYMADKPHINIIMGEPLGIDSRLCYILVDRIKKD